MKKILTKKNKIFSLDKNKNPNESCKIDKKPFNLIKIKEKH